MNPRFVNRFVAPLSALAWLCSAASASAAPDWDIVGIRLGMTPAQARAAVLAHAPKAEVTDATRQFTYNDSVRDQALPGFLASITARQGATLTKSETLEVMFSAPPMEQRVIRVIRHMAMVDDPLSMDRAMETVAQKYGKPPKVRVASDSRGNVLRWDEAGKTVCGDTHPNSYDGLVPPPVDNQPQALSGYEAWKRRKLAPADASNCSAALVVNLITKTPRGSLVTEMKFTMTDPGYAIPAMQATAKQIADKQAEARKSRESSGSVPKL